MHYWTVVALAECHCDNDGQCDPETGTCECPPGFHGNHCEFSCRAGSFGLDCSQKCSCENGATCSSVDGSCYCQSGLVALILQRH